MRTETNGERLAKEAERIRAANIRALKEKRQKFAPNEKNAAIFAAIGQEIEHWVAWATETIVERYKHPKQRRRILAGSENR